MSIHESMHSVGSHALNVAEAGYRTGPPLLMFHGVTQRWQTFLPLIPSLGLQHRLLLVDARGHGQSERGDGYRVVDYIDDACALVQSLDSEVAVYGHSLGAMVAAGVAVRMPRQVTTALLEDPPLHAMGERIAETYLLNFFTAVSRFAGSERDAGELAELLGQIELQDPRSSSSLRLADVRSVIQRRFSASCLLTLDPAVFIPILAGRWLDGFDVDDVFCSIECPTLLMRADTQAGGMLTCEDADHVASLNNSLCRLEFPGTGHMIHTGATQELLNAVISFLETAQRVT